MAPYLVIFFVVCALLQSALGSARGADNIGIFGGNEISIKDAPFMVVLYKIFSGNLYEPNCGGSIIHEQFILTAAHCAIRRNYTIIDIKVHVGTTCLHSGIVIDVVKAICHKKFSYKTITDDICLLKLRDPLKFGAKVAPVKLPDKNTELEIGTAVNVTGWGLINESQYDMASRLRQATLAVVSKETCRNIYPLWSSTEMCAGSTDHNICHGDSGSPLTNNGVQVGIASYIRVPINQHCGSNPAVFTEVASYLDWINTTITENL